jgi:Zn-dependent peptidase ImmA (M78 family)
MQTETHIFDLLRKFKITHADLGYAKYEIIITDNIGDNLTWGFTNTGTHTIYLHSSMHNQQARETLLHELTHCILEIIGYTSMDEDKQFQDDNEDLTTKISRGLLLLMNLNPTLMSLLITSNKPIIIA